MALDLRLPEDSGTFLQRLSDLPRGRRALVAIAGPPASGKSELANRLAVGLNQRSVNRAAVLPMDGYHFDDIILKSMGRLQRKGAHDTFDVGGLLNTLKRLRDNSEEAVAVPVFDRTLEVSRGAARLIPRSTEIILVEGNYLLSEEHPWGALASIFDLKVLLDMPEPVLQNRLLERWRGLGYSKAKALEKADDNDLPNCRYVLKNSTGADIVLHFED